jgi:hypothetical protein
MVDISGSEGPGFIQFNECNFDNLDVSADGQSYTIQVDVTEFSPKDGEWNFAVGFEVGAGATRDISVRLLEDDVEFDCSSDDSFWFLFGTGQDVGCFTKQFDKAIAPMLYTVEVKNSGDERWTDMPTIKGIVFGGHDVCEGHESTAGGMGGHGDNAKCEFFETRSEEDGSYIIDNIKTDEAGVWKFVFDKAAMIDFEIVGASAPAAQNFKCEQRETTTECSSGEDNPPIPSGTYTIQIGLLDGSIPNPTTYFVDNRNYCEGGSCYCSWQEGQQSTCSPEICGSGSHDNMESHGDANCDFSNINTVDDQFYKFAGIKTDEEGILKFVFVDPMASVMVSLEGEDTEFDVCENGECPSKTPVPAGTYTVEVQYFYRNEDGTIDPIFEDGKWTTAPLIKTYHVGDKNYCDNSKCSFFENMNDNDQSYTIDNIKTDLEGVWKFVFDKAAMINFEIVGDSAPAAQNFKCEKKETTTECSSGEDNPPIPSGTYTIQIGTDNN